MPSSIVIVKTVGDLRRAIECFTDEAPIPAISVSYLWFYQGVDGASVVIDRASENGGAVDNVPITGQAQNADK